eukprot:m.270264 g.270264  ORF g.270264 m.270264 type:complete len:62 (+) comp88793_c0_seq1:54-239(+)
MQDTHDIVKSYNGSQIRFLDIEVHENLNFKFSYNQILFWKESVVLLLVGTTLPQGLVYMYM